MNKSEIDSWEDEIPCEISKELEDQDNLKMLNASNFVDDSDSQGFSNNFSNQFLPNQQNVKKTPSDNSEFTNSHEKKIITHKSSSAPKRSFSKPIVIRANIRTVLPHLLLAITCLVVAFFPNVVVLMMGEGVEDLSDKFVAFLPGIISGLFVLLFLMILSMSIKQLSGGALHIFEGYVKYKKGLTKPLQLHHSNIHAVEVQRNLASCWSDTGDVIILHGKGDITIANVFQPFEIKRLLEDRINSIKNS